MKKFKNEMINKDELNIRLKNVLIRHNINTTYDIIRNTTKIFNSPNISKTQKEQIFKLIN